ncbi:MAG: aminotransferase class I/II-fold pyridoxal phosphate-dependent enzyme [Spirochaetales bacterium]|nr:aminotransferase class I/II-fold pyridoxal phosphate-dependent enzyme [Spirochaetales bacterium]
MKSRIYLSSPHMGGSEIEYVKEAFDTNWIAPAGPFLKRFEQRLCEYTGRAHSVVLSSGTAALHLALKILGVGWNDTVICQSFTFCGSANPVIYEGAIPVFIDSEPDTWNMDPELLERAIRDLIEKGEKPKAIIYVHLYGMPARVNEIVDISRKYEIAVIEDAAEALGAKYGGQPVGRFGDMSILSFNGNKIITTSGGGALLSDHEEWIHRARFLSTQARDDAPHYEHSQIGYNYRMSNVAAGIGLGQMEVLDEWVMKRRRNHDYYRHALGDVEGIEFLVESGEAFSNHWLTCIQVDPSRTGGITRENIRIALENENIESRPLWKPMHMQPVFRNVTFYGNGISEKLFRNGLCLPSGSNLSDHDLDRVIKVIKALIP